MQYAFQLLPHANIRYTDSLQKLACAELQCLLHGLGLEKHIRLESLGGAPFLLFEAQELAPEAIYVLSRHSAVYMAALYEEGRLRPLLFPDPWYLPGDVAQVLKYKGKTNAAFTMLMLNCALSASGFVRAGEPLTVMDPLCGKGTTLFCALRRGSHAVGLEIDRKALKECGDYFERYLQFHRCKHQRKASSLTMPGGGSATQETFLFASDSQKYSAGDTRTLRLIHGDTLLAGKLVKPQSVHLMAADLPYGVQHAPRDGAKPASFLTLLEKALPVWRGLIKKEGALALSFNTYTLKREQLKKALARAGFIPLDDAPYNDFAHWVEQAVNRDLIIAVPSHK